MRERYVVGVDGGASKTVALIGDSSGKILGHGVAGSSNFHNIGTRAAQRSVVEAVRKAQKEAHLAGKKVDVAIVALAAIDSAKDHAVAQRFVRAARIARRSYVVHDSIAALEAATHGEPGIIVISGTGSVAAGINSAGEYARVGGLGCLIDDEGSSYDIGRKALRAAFRVLDGRGPPTKLVSIFEREFGVKKLEDALNMIYSNGLTVKEIGRLAPLVSDACPDPVCVQILSEAGASLAELANTVAARLNLRNKPVKIAIFGGTFKSGKYLLESFQEHVKRECPFAEIIRPEIEPVEGSFWLAVQELSQSSAGTRVTATKAPPLVGILRGIKSD